MIIELIEGILSIGVLFLLIKIFIFIINTIRSLYHKIRFNFQNKKYLKTNYYKESQNDLRTVLNNKGTLGEYYTFNILDKVPGYKKIVVNCYLPKDDNTTTEIDIILIHETGIYVVECKNYKGWIFGNERDRYWTQSLHSGYGDTQKNKIFNPVIQNKVHIKWLKYILSDTYNNNYFSYVVFGNSSQFKDLTITSDVSVIKREDLFVEVKRRINNSTKVLSNTDVDHIYLLLKQYTNVTQQMKIQHIDNIKGNKTDIKSNCVDTDDN